MHDALQTALTKLRLSGLAAALDVRLQEAQGNSLTHIEFLELVLQDELAVRAERLIDRRIKLAAFREAVSVIVDGIGGGLFPARPGARRHDGGFENCHICPFDRICPRDRAAAWERKNATPALRDYVNLAEQE